MTSTLRKKQREKIRKAIEPVLCCYLEFPENIMVDLIEAILPLLPGGISEQTKDLLGMSDPELNARLDAESTMRERAEVALNITPDWDNPNSVWVDYNKKLVKKEKDTGFTIEEFVKWWNADDFRKEQGIWLNPEKINKFWETAMSKIDTSQTERPEHRIYKREQKESVPNPHRR